MTDLNEGHVSPDRAERDLGLSTSEAVRLLAVHGPNELPRAARRSVASRVLNQLRDPMILLLLGACVVTVLLGDGVDTVVIAAVIVLNSGIGVIQEVRAERALAALDDLAAPTAKVMRDHTLVVLPATEITPGDVVHVDAGDIVPADALLLESYRLQIDESAMTGESVPVEPGNGEEIKSGTVVTRGRAVALVTRTGASSSLGQIAELVASAPARPTPLQRRLSRLSRTLAGAAAVAAALVFMLGILQGRSPSEMLVVAVSLAVAAVPESLPAVVSVSLALGAYRMAQRAAIVRGLPAVETLGSVSVIASDKTGTLTEGRMVAREIWTPHSCYTVAGSGYAPTGAIVQVRAAEEVEDPLLADLLLAGVLCNDAQLLEPQGEVPWMVTGDPMEGALVALGHRGGLDPDLLRTTWPRTAEEPFDNERRLMTTRHAAPYGGILMVTKGAPESVLRLISDPVVTTEVTQAAARLARAGYRVIAIADCVRAAPTDGENYRFLGLVAISDPARETAKNVVRECREAGVRVVMVTGDHADTARAVATSVGITDAAPGLIQGEAVSRETLSGGLDEIGVYARTRPDQKVDIVQALQRDGQVVAVTGDGVNDAPALRAADIGVAMGRGGTEVARQAADLVLADDDLRTVVRAIEEGRRILANIRAFLRYALAGGLAEVIVMVAAPFLGMPIPLVPAQILWINLLTHGLPGVAFGTEPLDPAVMRKPSRSPDESVLGQGLRVQILLTGLLIAIVTLVAGAFADVNGAHVQSYVFVVLGLAQLGVALALRAPVAHRRLSGRMLELAVLVAAGLQLAALYAPPLQSLLQTEGMAGSQLALLLGLAAVPGVVVRLARQNGRIKQAPPVPPVEGISP